jgi:hypothetical protein
MHCSNPRIRDAQDRHSPCLKDFLSSVEIVRNNHREDTGLRGGTGRYFKASRAGNLMKCLVCCFGLVARVASLER